MSDDEKAWQDLRDRVTKLETRLAVIWHASSITAGAVGLFVLNAILNLTGK
jgi:hypothetical protein